MANTVTHTSVRERFRIFTVLIPLVAQCTRAGRAGWTRWGGRPYGDLTGHRASWGKLLGTVARGSMMVGRIRAFSCVRHAIR